MSKEIIYEYICRDCGEDFESKQKQNCCAQCSSPNIRQLSNNIEKNDSK